MTVRHWLTDEDEIRIIKDLRAWFHDHPGVTDPAEGVKALGLPDMTGVAENVKDRDITQHRIAKEAELVLLHAGYAMRHEAGVRKRGPVEQRTAVPAEAGE